MFSTSIHFYPASHQRALPKPLAFPKETAPCRGRPRTGAEQRCEPCCTAGSGHRRAVWPCPQGWWQPAVGAGDAEQPPPGLGRPRSPNLRPVQRCHLPTLSSKRQRDGLKSPTLLQQLGRVVLSRLKIYLRAHYYAEQFFIHRESTAAF